jgi:chromosome segregation ATPase
LSSVNESVTRENQSLRGDLENVKQDVIRSQAANRQLLEENQQLRHSLSHDGESVDRFRRRIAGLKVEIHEKNHTIRHLEKDNASLTARVRELTHSHHGHGHLEEQVAELSRNVFRWQERAGELQRIAKVFEERYDKAKRLLDDRIADIERKDIQLDHLRRRVHRLEDLLRHHGHFVFD